VRRGRVQEEPKSEGEGGRNGMDGEQEQQNEGQKRDELLLLSHSS